MAEPSGSGRRAGRADVRVYTDFLDFMSQMRREREDFRYESDVDLFSWLSDDDDESASDRADMESAGSSHDSVSSLSVDTLSGSDDADYSSFDELYSPGAMDSPWSASEDDTAAAGAPRSDSAPAAEARAAEPARQIVDSVASEIDAPSAAGSILERVKCYLDRCKLEVSASSRRPAKRRCSDSDAEAARCPICLEAWAAGGRHRVVALKCGHVFGYGCIRTWLLGARERARCCPTCKERASLYDIRYLRPPLVAAPEVSELRARLRRARDEARRVERAVSHCSEENRRCESERRTLARELTLLRAKRIRTG